MDISRHSLTRSSYYADSNPKDSIFLHHTGGYHRPDWVIDSWGRERENSTNKIRSGVAFVIGGDDITSKKKSDFDGVILEAFNPDFWSHHLFMKTKSNTFLNQKSIGIEICNYGELILTEGGEFFTHTNIKVPEKSVTTLTEAFKGEKYFHSYTESQIESLRGLILGLSEIYEIDVKRGIQKELERKDLVLPKNLSIQETKKWLNRKGITDGAGKKLQENGDNDSKYGQALEYLNRNPFDLSPHAMQGFQGIWSHSNVRADVKDVYPSPLLIEMLRSL